MTQWSSTEEILDFAIKNEEEAAKFYFDLSKRAEQPGMKEAFEAMAREEARHKAKLLKVKASGKFAPAQTAVADLKMSDYLVDVDPSADLDYQGSLILAMKKEKAAYKLYTDMARAATDPELREVLLALAQEEARHKLHFEVEYDDEILREN